MDASDGKEAGRIVGGGGRAIAGARIPADVHSPAPGTTIEDAWQGGCRVRRAFSDKFLRPGGTISGPTMMGLTDFAMYVAILASVGPVPLAVTTNLNINFLRKPARAT